MIANRTEFLEAIIRKLCSQVEISPGWTSHSHLPGGTDDVFSATARGHDTHDMVALTPEEYEAVTAIMNAPTRPDTIWSRGEKP